MLRTNAFFARVRPALNAVCFALVIASCTAQTPAPIPGAVDSYEACVKAGYAILKTLPPQCIGPDGRIFSDERAAGQARENAAKKSGCVDQCGDGQCQEMVCMAIGCPCAESSKSCPKDCAR